MARSRGRELARQEHPDANEVQKSIAALQKDATHVQKCMNAGLRDYSSGEKVIKEISDLIQQLKQKL